nr:S26 family signal peptidase [Streptomyces griseus]
MTAGPCGAGTPDGEASPIVPSRVLPRLWNQMLREPVDASTPRAARTALRWAAAAVWTGVPGLLLAGARNPALVCGCAASALTACIAVLATLERMLVTVTVRGQSMRPTFRDGDHVRVRRDLRPVPGRVIVIERPTPGARWTAPPVSRSGGADAIAGRQWLIKRVVAVAGDPIPRDTVPGLPDTADGLVPPGGLVILGDNPDNSLDSRSLGYLPVERVLGTATQPRAGSPLRSSASGGRGRARRAV